MRILVRMWGVWVWVWPPWAGGAEERAERGRAGERAGEDAVGAVRVDVGAHVEAEAARHDRGERDGEADGDFHFCALGEERRRKA